MAECNHYWLPIYHAAYRYHPDLSESARPSAKCTECGELKYSTSPQSAKRCVLCDRPVADDYCHATCETCISAGKLL